MKIKNVKLRQILAGIGAGFIILTTASPITAYAEEEVLFEVTEENNDEVNEGGEVEYEEVEDTDTSNVVIELPSVSETTTTTTTTETEETTTVSPILDDTNYNQDTDYVEEIPEDIETEWDRKHPTTPTPEVTPEPTTPEVTPEPTKPTDEPETVPQTGIVDDLGKYFLAGGILVAVYAALSRAGFALKTAGADWQQVTGVKSTVFKRNKKDSKELTK